LFKGILVFKQTKKRSRKKNGLDESAHLISVFAHF